MNTPRAVSVSTSPSTAIWPRVGRISPAIALTSEVLPEPERPNSAVSPPPLSKAAASRKPPRRCSPATLSMSYLLDPLDAPRGALDQRLGGEQCQHRNRDRDERQPQCREIAARHLDEHVDRRRQCLGLAGNVRDKGDRRAEFAECPGKGPDHAGEDARKG